jgi:protein SCO1/2
MNSGSRNLQITVWAILGLVLAAVAALFLNAELHRSKLPELGAVKPFTLTNQLGQTVTSKDFAGHVWLADIIFTRCGGPCPKMTELMSHVQKAFSPSEDLRFVTLTTDPDYDTPAVMKRYGERFNADPARWEFLSGPKSEILRNLATGSLKLAAVDKDAADRENDHDLFIHSTTFVLVDKHGVIRGYYESLEPGFQEKVGADIRLLLQES